MAQYYEQAVGLRGGGSAGVTYKKFFSDMESLDLLLSGRNDGLQLTVLHTFNKPLKSGISDNFFFYYGIGGHVGWERVARRQRLLIINNNPPGPNTIEDNFNRGSEFSMGVNGIAGVEYRFLGIPFAVGLDVKPYLNFIGFRTTQFRFWDAALSVKYVF